MMPAWSGITTIAAPSHCLRRRRLCADPVYDSGGQNCRRVHGCRSDRLGKLAVRDYKLEGSRLAFRRVLSGAEELALGAIRNGLIFELGSVARRVAVVILDRTAAGDNEAALANLRQCGFGVGGNPGLVPEFGTAVMGE